MVQILKLRFRSITFSSVVRGGSGDAGAPPEFGNLERGTEWETENILLLANKVKYEQYKILSLPSTQRVEIISSDDIFKKAQKLKI